MYIVEAIRMFNSLTGLHRATDNFNTSSGIAFYDLPTLLTTNVLARTVTDQDTIALMQYQLMEKKYPTAGTDMWVLDQFTKALQRRRNQFIYDTGIGLVQRSVNVAATDLFDLPDTVMGIRRAVWKDASTGNYYSLWPSDESMSTRYALQPAIPSNYSIATTPELQGRLAPQPLADGTIEMLTLESGADLNPATPVILGIPNDLAWGPRMGAMADLLRQDGPARDSDRADICEELYGLAVQAGRVLPVVLNVFINGKQITPTTLARLDGLRSGWQGQNLDTPDQIGIASPALIAACPLPDGSHSITVDVVRNAIIPTVDGSFLQVPREDLDAILAWAEFLACFKSQGTSLENAKLGSRRLLDRAAQYNERRNLQANFIAQIFNYSSDERGADRPLFRTDNSDDPDQDKSDTASTKQSRSRSVGQRRVKRLGGR